MEDFDEYVGNLQISWRRSHIGDQTPGEQNGQMRPWILPNSLWKQGLWPGIKESLPNYLDQSRVQKHDGVHNLKSSWMLCANLYFPFSEDRPLVAGFLRKHVSPSIETVEGIELEYEDDRPDLKPAPLLGEPQGQRGRNQTSPDVAFIVRLKDGKAGLVLTEVKFTEHSFYACSGRNKKYENPDRRRCMDFRRVHGDTESQCYQLQWADGDRTNRKYWEYLKFTPTALETLRRCPASTSGCQLFRQQALAEALARKGPYGLVVSCVAHDDRNQALLDCLRGTGIRDFTTGWGPLFHGKAKFATFTHQQWVGWVADNDTKGRWRRWLEYVKTRYGLGGTVNG
ncbi:MAG: hypothetical protein QUS33_10315 [Dehalococcoidia bacterium]|nr:hypothetical protein [Dehalococcoidia bacterium]